MSLEGYEQLKLDKQLCFPLYAAAKEVVRKYKPFLDELDLTYTQYITMMVLWENESMNVKELGSKLYLDSGTLTPLLKKLEAKGYITRCRCKEDERNLIIQITEKGEELKEIFVLADGENHVVEVKGKEFSLNRLHIGNRDTKGVRK